MWRRPRLLQSVKRRIYRSEVEKQNRVSELVANCLVNAIKGDFTLSGLVRQHAQHMQSIGLIGFDLQHLQVNLFSLWSIPLLVKADCETQCLVDSQMLQRLGQCHVTMCNCSEASSSHLRRFEQKCRQHLHRFIARKEFLPASQDARGNFIAQFGSAPNAQRDRNIVGPIARDQVITA